MAGELDRYGNMGELRKPGQFGSFRTSEGVVPHRSHVRALPDEPPRNLHEGIVDATAVHLLGTDQNAQMRAIRYGIGPDVSPHHTVWAADLTGLQITEDLTARAASEGQSVLHWPDVSPTLIVANHRKPQAAEVIVNSLQPSQQGDPTVTTSRQINLERIMDITSGDKPDLGKVAWRTVVKLPDTGKPPAFSLRNRD